MREAIARAELGDDVYGEDPTVNRLEAMAAAIMGKDAAMLVPSGTMGNLAAMLTHCARGSKALVGSQSHTNLYEAGGASALGGIGLPAIANTEAGRVGTPARAHQGGPPDPAPLRHAARRSLRAAGAGGDREHPQPMRRRADQALAHGRGSRSIEAEEN